MTSGFNNGHRKLLQPKQAKEFSPLKTALILDHYTSSTVNKEGGSSTTKNEKKLLVKSIEKSYKIQQQNSQTNLHQGHHQQLMQITDPQHNIMQRQNLSNNPQNTDFKEFYQRYNTTNNHPMFPSATIQGPMTTSSDLQVIQNHDINRQEQQLLKKQLLKKVQPLAVVNTRRKLEAIDTHNQSDKVYFSQPRGLLQITGGFDQAKINQMRTVYLSNQQKGFGVNPSMIMGSTAITLSNQNPIKRQQQNKQTPIIKKYQNIQQVKQLQQQYQTTRYVSQEPPKMYPLFEENEHSNQEGEIEDQELMSFQIEIERRYKNSVTKGYKFPRQFIKDDQPMIQDQLIQQAHSTIEAVELMETSNEDYMVLNTDPSLVKSIVNKYHGLHQAQKERFCDKLKSNKPSQLKQLQQSQSTNQLQIKSVQKIQNETQQQQFFQNTHKRINKNPSVKQLDLKTMQQSMVSSILNPSLSQKTLQNMESRMEHNKQPSYFVSGNIETQQRNIRGIIDQANQEKQTQKQKQLGHILKQISGGTPITSSFVDANFNKPGFINFKNGQSGKKQQQLDNGNSQKSSLPHSRSHSKTNIDLIMKSPSSGKKLTLITTPLANTQQNNTPSKQKAIQKLVNLQNQNFMQIVQSYKNFKQLDDLTHTSRTSRNSSTNRSKDQHSSHARSKRGNSHDSNHSKQKHQQQQQNSIIGSHLLQQNLQLLNIKPVAQVKQKMKKLKTIASTLQITGSQALKKSYEFYNSGLNSATSANHGFKSPQQLQHVQSQQQIIGVQQMSIPLSVKNHNMGSINKYSFQSPHTGGSGFPNHQTEFQPLNI